MSLEAIERQYRQLTGLDEKAEPKANVKKKAEAKPEEPEPEAEPVPVTIKVESKK